MTWDLDRVERAAKAEGYEAYQPRDKDFVHVEPGVRLFANGDVLMITAHIDSTRRAIAAYDAIVARMARELPDGWQRADIPVNAEVFSHVACNAALYINPAHYPEAAKALRELADWLDKQVKP